MESMDDLHSATSSDRAPSRASPWMTLTAPSLPLASVVVSSEKLQAQGSNDPLSFRKASQNTNENNPHQTCGKTQKYANDTLNTFNDVTGDIRRTFLNWFNTVEVDLCGQWDELRLERELFEEQKSAEIKRLADEREREMDRLAEQRQKAAAEQKTAVKQIATEREETRKKLDEERRVFLEDIENVKDTISRDKEALRVQVAHLESEKARVVDHGLAAQTMVELNVGGTVFESSKHTVSQQKGSFLDSLFAGKHKVVRDKNQRIFLDRDPELFRSILNFLRNPSTPPFPADESQAKSLVEEAQFYGIKFFPFPMVYALGGYDGTNYLRSCELLDVASQTWKFVKSMNTERAYAGSSCLGGRLYTFGGQNRDYKVMYDTEVFDVLRGDWYNAPPMETPRRNHASCGTHDRLFAIGGYDGTNLLSSVEMLDERLRHWNYLSPMPSVRSACSAVVLDNLHTGYQDLFVTGGTDGRRLKSLIRYDIRADRWETIDKDMIEVRSAGNAVVHQGQLYCLGGLNALHQVNASMETLDLAGGTLQRDWHYLPGLSQPRLEACSAGVSESLLTVGGQYDGTVLDTVEFYRPELSQWQTGPRLHHGRYAHCLEVCSI